MVSWQNRLLVLFAVLSTPVFADQKDLLVNTFGGLNTQDSRAALQPYESPDLLNINLQVGLKSVFKRDGYGLFQTLPINTSTTAVHGGYHFQQLSGNDVQLWGNDTELSGSVNDNTFVKLATGTVSATWQCTDNLGFAYCVDSLNDTPVKTDGTLANTTYQQGAIPSGTLITNTPTRLVVGGVSGSGSTINFSQSNTFTNFTVGPLQTDPFTEVINAPGSRLTHLAYYFGKVYWWKDQSFGFADCQDQYNCAITIVSNQIGTLDNSSAFWNGTTFESGPNAFSSGASPYTSVGIIGGIFFRGQDNHIYVYDGYALTRLTRRITPTINNLARKKANSFTQSTASQYNNGVSTQVFALSTAISPGTIVLSTNNFSDNLWSSGTLIQVDTNTQAPNLILSSFSVMSTPANQSQLTNNGSGDLTGTPTVSNWMAQSFTTDGSVQSITTAKLFLQKINGGCDTTFRLKNDNNNSPGTDILTSAITASNMSTTGALYVLNLTTTSLQPNTKYWFYTDGCGGGQNFRDVWFYATGNPYANGKAVDQNNIPPFDGTQDFEFEADMIGGTSFQYFSTGSVTSRTFDITLTSPTFTPGATYYALLNSSETDNGQSISYWYESSTDGVVWSSSITVSTNTSFGPLINRYYRYIAQLNSSNPSKTPVLGNVATKFEISTGTYLSVVENAPNITSWGNLTETDFTPGNSTITYWIRAGTNSFTVTGSTPSWTLQIKNAIPAITTGTFMQLRADFVATASTEAPSLGPFTFNWFEGNAADKAYITYFQDYIWFAVSSGTVGTNNRLLRLDLLNNVWLLDDIATNGFLVENNTLYLGDPVQGRVFKFGGVPTDNGNPINAYWQSKDFAGDDPTVQNEFQRVDFVFDVTQTTVSYIITFDQNATQTILIPLTLSNPTFSTTITKRGFLLQPGKIGTFYNFRIGDNSSNPRWRLLFHNMKYTPFYWKPQTS